MSTATDVQAAAVMTTGAQLRKLIGWARPAARPALPILGAVRVTVTGTRLILATFDYETARVADTEGTPAAEPGPAAASALVPGNALAGMIRALPSGKTPVEVAVRDSEGVDLTAQPLTTRAARLTVPALDDPAGYPPLPGLPPARGTISGDVFRGAAARLTLAASDDDTLPVIGCVHLTFGNRLAADATDRYVLVAEDLDWTPAHAKNPPREVNVPATAVAAFAKAAAGDLVFVFADAEHAAFTDGSCTMITRTVPGDYPRVRQFIKPDSDYPSAATADAAELAAALADAAGVLDAAVKTHKQRCGDCKPATLCPQGSALAKLPALIDVGPAGLTVRAHTLTRPVAAQVDAEECTLRFNPRFLTTVTGAGPGPVAIRWLSPVKPARVTLPGVPGYQAVIMPVRDAK